MADEKKSNLAKEVADEFVTNIKKDAVDRGKSLAYGLATDILDMVGANIKKGISHYIYPDGSAPRDNRRNGRDDDSHYYDYSSRARINTRSRDPIGNRSAQDISTATFPTKESAEEAVRTLFRKMDESSINACRVGDLYELSKPKIAASTQDWAFGWIDADKGSFSTRPITSGEYAGYYTIVTPRPRPLS